MNREELLNLRVSTAMIDGDSSLESDGSKKRCDDSFAIAIQLESFGLVDLSQYEGGGLEGRPCSPRFLSDISPINVSFLRLLKVSIRSKTLY